MENKKDGVEVPTWVVAAQVVLLLNSLAFGLTYLFILTLLSIPFTCAVLMFVSWKKEKEQRKIISHTIKQTLTDSGIKKTVDLMED